MAGAATKPLALVGAVLLPPAGVYLERGLSRPFWIATALTVAGFLPGVAYALYMVLSAPGALTRLQMPVPMRLALDEAAAAGVQGEVPVGAVVMRAGAIVATGRNATRTTNDPTAHAEIVAIRAASALLSQDRLVDCELWVTLEPCAMCAGAIAHARIARLIYAADDPKGGGVEHGARVFAQLTCHHRPEVVSGVGAGEAATLLKSFFAARR